MAINDKKGHIHGKVASYVYRSSRGKQIIQSAPRPFKQTLATTLTKHEFGLASTQAALIRRVINTLIDASDGRMYNRLTSAIRNCLHYSEQTIGNRDLHNVDLQHLHGFQFNLDAPFEKVLKKQPSCKIDDRGDLSFELRIDDPYKDFAYFSTKRRSVVGIRISTIAFNFKEEYYQAIDSQEFRIDRQGETIKWESKKNLPAGSVIFAILSLHYYQAGWLADFKSAIEPKYSASGILSAFHATEDMSDKGSEPERLPLANPVIASTATNNKLRDIQYEINKEEKKKNKKHEQSAKGRLVMKDSTT
ncbi:hypothetical protein [Olivibacter sp. XZL3]|uniref:hypothetical protein n=1 Tax=Olivibacter sp. XZL3 TaxID=1735116 RepID=UPI0010653023|nr:hypothetical protein [Olivibacter sp. XZL3]